MNEQKFKQMVKDIVKQACDLKDKYIDYKDAKVNYACIFCQSDEEFNEFKQLASKIGKVIQETAKGPLFHINALDTVSGKLKLLKVRMPDPTRKERGDADFTIPDYLDFKEKYLSQKGWSLLKKSDDFEMLELMDPEFNVRVYFSYPPLDEQLGIK